MRRAFRFASSLLLWATGVSLGHAESTWEFSVQLSAAVQSSPAQITLTWPQDSYLLPNNYTVYRKAPGSDSWGSGVSLPGIATNYVDNSVSVGSAYEYQVVKTTSQYKGYGYIYSGMEVPLTDQRGKDRFGCRPDLRGGPRLGAQSAPAGSDRGRLGRDPGGC
jgi:hypothetical protein